MARESRRRFEAAFRDMAPDLRDAFLQAIGDLRSVAQMQIIEAAIERRDIEAIVQALRLGPEFFAPLDDAMRRAFIAGGAYAINSLPKTIPASGGGPLIVRFQGRHPRAEAWLSEASGTLIREIVDDQRAVIREAMRTGLELGQNPRRTALEIVGRIDRATGRRRGGVIGLTSREAGFVRNLRAELSSPSTASGYFSRQARDRRFDRLVRRSIQEGKPLSQADIERIAGRYSDRLLALRGERIARTETIRALNAGRVEGMAQIVDSGVVSADAVTKVWHATPDGRTRDAHASMNRQTVRFDQTFTSPTGARMGHPGDTSHGAGGEDVIACRCWMEQKIDWLAGAA